MRVHELWFICLNIYIYKYIYIYIPIYIHIYAHMHMQCSLDSGMDALGTRGGGFGRRARNTSHPCPKPYTLSPVARFARQRFSQHFVRGVVGGVVWQRGGEPRILGLGSRVWGLGFGVWGLRFGVWGLGCSVRGLGFGVWNLGFGGWRLGHIRDRPEPCDFVLCVRRRERRVAGVSRSPETACS